MEFNYLQSNIPVYRHSWSLQPFSQNYDLTSLLLSLFIFIHKWPFKVDSERKTLLEIFEWEFWFTLRIFARNLMRANRQ